MGSSSGYQLSTLTHDQLLISRRLFLASALAPGGLLVLPSLVFVMPLADLLFDLLGDQINRGIEISFDILSEQVRAGQRQAQGTGKLPVGRFGLVVLQCHAGADSKPIQVLQFIDSADNVIFNGFRQGHVMGRKD